MWSAPMSEGHRERWAALIAAADSYREATGAEVVLITAWRGGGGAPVPSVPRGGTPVTRGGAAAFSQSLPVASNGIAGSEGGNFRCYAHDGPGPLGAAARRFLPEIAAAHRLLGGGPPKFTPPPAAPPPPPAAPPPPPAAPPPPPAAPPPPPLGPLVGALEEGEGEGKRGGRGGKENEEAPSDVTGLFLMDEEWGRGEWGRGRWGGGDEEPEEEPESPDESSPSEVGVVAAPPPPGPPLYGRSLPVSVPSWPLREPPGAPPAHGSAHQGSSPPDLEQIAGWMRALVLRGMGDGTEVFGDLPPRPRLLPGDPP